MSWENVFLKNTIALRNNAASELTATFLGASMKRIEKLRGIALCHSHTGDEFFTGSIDGIAKRKQSNGLLFVFFILIPQTSRHSLP